MFASWSTEIMSAIVLIRYQGDELSCQCTVAGTAQFHCKQVSPDARQLALCYSAQELHIAYACVKFTAYLTNFHKNEFQLYFKVNCMTCQPFTNKQSPFFGKTHARLKLIVKVCYGLQGLAQFKRM